MKEKFNEKVIPVILKFINTKGIQSIKNGMVTSMSPLIIGSIFLILSNFPVKAVVDVLESTGIKAVLDQACGATFSISAMIAVIGISYSYAKHFIGIILDSDAFVQNNRKWRSCWWNH